MRPSARTGSRPSATSARSALAALLAGLAALACTTGRSTEPAPPDAAVATTGATPTPRIVAAPVDAQASARAAADLAGFGRTYAEQLASDARAAAAPGGDAADRAALALWTRAEEEIQVLLDASMRAHDDARRAYEQLYRQAIAESDTLVQRIFTPAVIDALPWRDLLADGETRNWVAGEADGFEHRIERGTLHLVAAPASAQPLGILSIGDLEQWRDFVLDMEFTSARGEARIYFRLGRLVDDMRTEFLTIDSGEAGDYRPGRTYSARVQFIGSDRRVDVDPPDGASDARAIHWPKSRKGALGIFGWGGSDVTFTRLRIKVLR